MSCIRVCSLIWSDSEPMAIDSFDSERKTMKDDRRCAPDKVARAYKGRTDTIHFQVVRVARIENEIPVDTQDPLQNKSGQFGMNIIGGGNPIDGLYFYGPFANTPEAIE
jgi:hypothetical protein